MRQMFIMSGRDYAGNCGGSAGVNYRLFTANSKYGLIPGMRNIFLNTVRLEYMAAGRHGDAASRGEANASLKYIKKALSKFCWARYCKYKFLQLRIWAALKRADRAYGFHAEDIYVFHDMDIAYIFLKKFHFPHTYLCYHQQGSLYSEWRSVKHRNSRFQERMYERITLSVLNMVSNLCFPSKGAEKAFIETSSGGVGRLVKRHRPCPIFYNGFDAASFNMSKETENVVKDFLKTIDNPYVFITVSNLNDAKAVERIPGYLNKLKKELNIKLLWILVGDGANQPVVEKEIRDNHLEDATLWLKNRISHDDILGIMSLGDFYIMLHRYSIFDFATIEAMGMGTIPVLSNTGGNQEVIVWDNGILLDEGVGLSAFKGFVEKYDIEDMKKRNQYLQHEHFGEYVFLKRYADLLAK